MKKLVAAAAAVLLLLGANLSFADRDGWKDHGRGRGHDREWRDNDRGWDHHDRDDWHRHDRDRDRVSVSLSFGNAWGSPFYRDRSWNGVGVGYDRFDSWGYDRRYRNNRPVVVYQNNTYIAPAPRTRVITRSNPAGTSLLRDIDGRCFERETDRNGNERRMELPSSACNF
ncbi:MAG: hypothetical protein RLZZ227_1912 [Pseudomonadota bacterium]